MYSLIDTRCENRIFTVIFPDNNKHGLQLMWREGPYGPVKVPEHNSQYSYIKMYKIFF